MGKKKIRINVILSPSFRHQNSNLYLSNTIKFLMWTCICLVVNTYKSALSWVWQLFLHSLHFSHGKAGRLKGKVSAYWKSWFGRLGPSFTLIPAGKGCPTHAWAPAINQSLYLNGFTFSFFLSSRCLALGTNRACKAAFEYLCCLLMRIFIYDLWDIIFAGSLLIFKAVPFLRYSGITSVKRDVTCTHILQVYLWKYPLNSQE